MANAGAAFGLEDVPDLPEAPTEQPKYNRDYHRLFVKFMSWLHKRTYTKRLASNLVLWPASNHTTLPTTEMAQEGYFLYMPIKGAHGMEPPQSNQVRSCERSGQGSQESGESTPRQEVCATRDLTETEYRKVVHELYGKGSFNRPSVQPAC
ncbi:hypothetical protein SEMRO_149_G068550.1 [Seminavis robusta]|uniref:Uncharacterized protein n=1 Tax=Seminavis robusta TaxID=568900 RepID=A0A9N8H6K1_9STRA|nr:hypothetical protein SEMRO_149_G068550.1 [Seminavis robusta]|eukprot:Sro149_g068550.1 n/a (151) ;mRNA; f:68632-69162